MKQYLLDTNVCVFFLRDKYGIREAIRHVGVENCHISEITLAELYFGAECSRNPLHEYQLVEDFAREIDVVPLTDSLRVFAHQKARLRKEGTPVDDMDLLIGATALRNGMVLATENIRHFKNIEGLPIENWVKR